MAFPTAKISISFNAADGPYTVSPTWTDVTQWVRDISINRGRNAPSEEFSSGSAQLTLDNRDGRFTPWNTSGAYYGTGTSVVPRRQIKIEGIANATTYPVFRGYVSAWPVDYTLAGTDSTVTISCFDLQGLLASVENTPDWADQYILSLNPLNYWKCNEPSNSATIKDFGSQASTLTNTSGGSLVSLFSLAPGIPYNAASIELGTYGYGTSGAPGPTTGDWTFAFWYQSRNGTPPHSFNLLTFSQNGSGYLIVDAFIAAIGGSSQVTATSFISANTAHHIAITHTASSGAMRIYIDGQDKTGVQTAATGFLGSYINAAYISGGTSAQTVFVNSVLSAAQILKIFQLSSSQITETSSARIQRILDQITNLNASSYAISASPVTTVAEIDNGGPVITQLGKAWAGEGDIYVSRAGVLTFTNQNYAYVQGSTGTTTAATFTDTGSNLSYGTDLSVDYSADQIANRISVQYSGGATATISNSTSTAAYGVVEKTIDSQISTVAQATDLATTQSLTQGVVKPRFSTFSVSSNTADASWQTILGLELLSKISLTRTPSSGSAISSILLVDNISHQITPLNWQTSLTASAQNAGWFVLDSSILDGPDLLL
jgi:hypothetical protein